MRDRQTLSLRYGHGFQEFVIPASTDIFDIREPQQSVSHESFRQGLAGVFPEIISEGQIAIVVADKTRLCGYPTVLPWLLENAVRPGVFAANRSFFISPTAPMPRRVRPNRWPPMDRYFVPIPLSITTAPIHAFLSNWA